MILVSSFDIDSSVGFECKIAGHSLADCSGQEAKRGASWLCNSGLGFSIDEVRNRDMQTSSHCKTGDKHRFHVPAISGSCAGGCHLGMIWK